jgi:hypothetical protein
MSNTPPPGVYTIRNFQEIVRYSTCGRMEVKSISIDIEICGTIRNTLHILGIETEIGLGGIIKVGNTNNIKIHVGFLRIQVDPSTSSNESVFINIFIFYSMGN